MRIVIDARKIADFGIGTYIRGLLSGLVELERGDEIVALAPGGAVLPRGVEGISFDAPHYSMSELWAVGRAARKAGADVLHSPHYIAPMTRIPLVVTVHDLIHLHHPRRNPLAPMYARSMIGRAVRNAARVLTVSDTVKRQLIGEMGADAEKIIVTPNGVEIRGGESASEAAPASDRFFLYAGNDKPHKNVDGLIEAFRRIRSASGLRLVLTGAPFARFAAEDGVEPAGFVSDERLRGLYRGALAVIVPSHEEGFGLPALEAMAHGTAVITSNAPALIEVTGDAALHADARDPSSFAAAMHRVANDDSLRFALAARGLERARAFTWKRCAELTRAAYEASIHAR